MGKKIIIGTLVLFMSCFLLSSKVYCGINVDSVLDLFSNTIKNIFSPISDYIKACVFSILGNDPLVNEDQYGNVTIYGEFGPEKMLDKEGNLLKEWKYENGKLSQEIEYTDTGKIITYYEYGKAQVSEWFPSGDIYNDSILQQLGLEKGEHGGWVVRRYHYTGSGMIDYVEEFTLDSVDEGTEGAVEITIGENTFYVKGKWQITHYNSLGKIDYVTDSEGNMIRDYVYKYGVLDHIDVYGGTDGQGNPVVTARIYYVGERPDRVVRVENSQELTGSGAVAQVYYNGAKIDRIEGPGDLIRALGYGVTSDEAGLTLHFNDMGLPSYVENSEGATIQVWLYSWDLKGKTVDDILDMFGWKDSSDARKVAQAILDIKNNVHPRLVATLTLSPKQTGSGSSWDSNMYVSSVNLLGMFSIDTAAFDPPPPPRRASPTVTGNLSYDAQTDTWYMRVYVWTGEGDPNNIHVDKEYWDLLNAAASGDEEAIRKLREEMGCFDINSQEDAQRDIEEIEARLKETGGELVIKGPTVIELRTINLSKKDLEFLQNNIGNVLTVHGWTIDGLIKNGYVLEVVGFGKWSYEPYHPELHPFEL